MARYIDADALKNELISSGAICDFGKYLIDIQPAADVRPERHGECGGDAKVNTNPYCWKCGAKMDGKDIR